MVCSQMSGRIMKKVEEKQISSNRLEEEGVLGLNLDIEDRHYDWLEELWLNLAVRLASVGDKILCGRPRGRTGWRGGLRKEEKIKDSLSEAKGLELDFRVVKIDVREKERRNWKLASTFSKPDLYDSQLDSISPVHRVLDGHKPNIDTCKNGAQNEVRGKAEHLDQGLKVTPQSHCWVVVVWSETWDYNFARYVWKILSKNRNVLAKAKQL